MPVPVRALLVMLVVAVAVVAVYAGTSWLDALDPAYDPIYNAALLGSSMFCLARSALRRDERVAWALIGGSLGLWAAGNIIWWFWISDLEEAPYPSAADALWLAFLPVCYAGLLLLARQRTPHLDSEPEVRSPRSPAARARARRSDAVSRARQAGRRRIALTSDAYAR
jgi:hypothetical protein